MKHIISPNCFSESAVATFIVTPEHEVVFWNKACEKLTGVTSEQVLATKNHWQAFYPEKRACLVDIVIDGNFDILPELYEEFGKSKLSPEGICAEGWFDNLGGKKRYVIFDASPVYNPSGELVAAIETLQDITEIKSDGENDLLVGDLKKKIEEIRNLKGFLPICSSCKDVRKKTGDWISIEEFLLDNSRLLFSHGICPKCAKKLYPEFYDKMFKKKD